MLKRAVLMLLMLQLTVVPGCSKGPPPIEKKPTSPVSGVLHIDGKPTASVQLYLHPADNAPSDQSTPFTASPSAVTDDAGKFAFGTYDSGDGLPEGSYVISSYWDGGVVQPLIRDNDDPPKLPAGAEKFNRQYGSPAASKIKFTVEPGKPVDLGVLDLKSK